MAVNRREESRYSAPALEKGLDILETLAAAPGALTQKQLTEHLRRSVGEIFRMLSVLEARGYVARAPDGGYLLTVRLYELAHRHPPLRRLITSASPVLEALAVESLQSCYLVVVDGDHLVVVAQADPPTWRVLSVKLGARFDLAARSTSALVIAAFLEPAERAALMTRMGGDEVLTSRLDAIVKDGSAVVQTARIPGVTDISAPVFDALGRVVAALSLNYLPQRDASPALAEVRSMLVRSAAAISHRLGCRPPG